MVPVGMIAGAAMDIAGTAIGSGEADRVAKILRSLPEFKPVDLSAEQAATTTGNLQNLAAAKALAGQVNEFDTQQLLAQMRAAVPGFDQIRSQASSNIISQLKGEVPSDVSAQITRSAAERAAAGGVYGSPFAEGVRLRDLGTTSLAITQQGIDSAMRWLGTAKQTMVAPQLSASAMFFTPSQRAQLEFANREMQYQSDMNVALGKTAPGVTAYWANNLKRAGGMLMGSGIGNIGGGGGATDVASSLGGAGFGM